MTGLWAVLWAKARIARHSIASVRNESKLKVGVVSISAALLWIGAFVAFREGFQWLRNFEVASGPSYLGLGDLIMLRLLSVFALALFLMLVFSNALVSFSTIYRTREVAYLLQAPLTFREFFLVRLVECVVFSSWASAYLGSPLVLAYGLTTGSPWPFYAAALAFYIPFVWLPAALGSLITVLLVRCYPAMPRYTLPTVAGVVVVILFFYLRATLIATETPDDSLFLGTEISRALGVSQRMQSPWLPSHWASQGIILASWGRYSESGFYLLLLTANALMATWVAAEAAARLFHVGWSQLAGLPGRSARRNGRGFFALSDRALRVLSNPARALVAKDVRLFWRDPTQWGQFLLFFGIMAVYIATLRDRDPEGVPHYRSWIAAMNIGASTLVLATLTSRFVFPLVSLEGRRFWIVGLAPITIRQIVWQKFWLSVATTSAFTITLVVLSCIRLGIEPIAFTLAVYTIIVTNFGLSGLAVGLGSLYPNFQEDNPARVVSGMGGTLNFLASMAYISLVVAALTVMLQWEALGLYPNRAAFWWTLAAVGGFITVLSAVCTLLPMKLGLHNLMRTEF